MPQNSQRYAIGRVRALSRTLLTRAAIERMIAACDIAEMARVLAEAGWGEAHTQEQVEALADARLAQACRLLREITPDEQVTDCFLLRYDIVNLKALFKARMLGTKDVLLSDNGLIEPETLRRCVGEGKYAALGEEMRPALEEVERRIALEEDALFVDARLDRLLFEMIADRLARAAKLDKALRDYFAALSDKTNVLIALRVRRMGREEALCQEMFVRGGRLTPQEVFHAVAEDRGVAAPARAKLEPGFVRALESGLQALARRGGLALLEKRLEDYLLSLVRPGRYSVEGLLPLVGYFLACEREATAVRLIAAAKAVGASVERLEENLRETYA